MSQLAAAPKKGEIVNASEFRARSVGYAHAMLKDWVGEERAREATGRIATAISASAAAAKNPKDFYECTPQSIAKVIAVSALTGIMVSTGQASLAYAIPRRARKGEPPQLQYQLSHRGIAALARRAGLGLVAYPISVRDTISVDENGEVVVEARDIDNPPTCEEDMRGVMVLTRQLDTGTIVSRGFVAKSIINVRREQSDSYQYALKNEWARQSDPWHKWYVEMSIKTALHYAIGRGWCVIDDTEAIRALQVDAEGDYTPTPVQVTFDEDTAGATRTANLTERLSEQQSASTDTEPASEPNESSDPHGDLLGNQDAPSIVEQYTHMINEAESDDDRKQLADVIKQSTKLSAAERELLLKSLVPAKAKSK